MNAYYKLSALLLFRQFCLSICPSVTLVIKATAKRFKIYRHTFHTVQRVNVCSYLTPDFIVVILGFRPEQMHERGILPTLIMLAYRKSHTGCRMLRKSVTFEDLELRVVAILNSMRAISAVAELVAWY